MLIKKDNNYKLLVRYWSLQPLMIILILTKVLLNQKFLNLQLKINEGNKTWSQVSTQFGKEGTLYKSKNIHNGKFYTERNEC